MKKNLFALGGVALLMLVGAGCKSETNFTVDEGFNNPSEEVDHGNEMKDTTGTQVQAASDVQVQLNTEPEVKVVPKTEAKVEPTPEPKMEAKKEETPPAPPVQIKPEVKAEVKAEVKDFTVTASNFSFSPASMKVKKGDKVRITFKNSGGFHDFVIDQFLVATKQIGDGAQDVVEFTADKVGSFEYYCSVGSHRAMGMKGTLTVTE